MINTKKKLAALDFFPIQWFDILTVTINNNLTSQRRCCLETVSLITPK